MKKFECPVCAFPITVNEPLVSGTRLVCENCFTELALHKNNNEFALGCPFCKNEVFDPANCLSCERREEKVEKWNLHRFIKL